MDHQAKKKCPSLAKMETVTTSEEDDGDSSETGSGEQGQHRNQQQQQPQQKSAVVLTQAVVPSSCLLPSSVDIVTVVGVDDTLNVSQQMDEYQSEHFDTARDELLPRSASSVSSSTTSTTNDSEYFTPAGSHVGGGRGSSSRGSRRTVPSSSTSTSMVIACSSPSPLSAVGPSTTATTAEALSKSISAGGGNGTASSEPTQQRTPGPTPPLANLDGDSDDSYSNSLRHIDSSAETLTDGSPPLPLPPSMVLLPGDNQHQSTVEILMDDTNDHESVLTTDERQSMLADDVGSTTETIKQETIDYFPGESLLKDPSSAAADEQGGSGSEDGDGGEEDRRGRRTRRQQAGNTENQKDDMEKDDDMDPSIIIQSGSSMSKIPIIEREEDETADANQNPTKEQPNETNLNDPTGRMRATGGRSNPEYSYAAGEDHHRAGRPSGRDSDNDDDNEEDDGQESSVDSFNGGAYAYENYYYYYEPKTYCQKLLAFLMATSEICDYLAILFQPIEPTNTTTETRTNNSNNNDDQVVQV